MEGIIEVALRHHLVRNSDTFFGPALGFRLSVRLLETVVAEVFRQLIGVQLANSKSALCCVPQSGEEGRLFASLGWRHDTTDPAFDAQVMICCLIWTDCKFHRSCWGFGGFQEAHDGC